MSIVAVCRGNFGGEGRRAVSSILAAVASIRCFNEFNRRPNMAECWPETSISRRSFQFSAAEEEGEGLTISPGNFWGLKRATASFLAP